MRKRVEKLEEFVEETRAAMRAIDVHLVRIETQLEGINTQIATKADLQKMTADLIRWIVGTAVVISTAATTTMIFALNNAVQDAHTAGSAPIVIMLPAQAS